MSVHAQGIKTVHAGGGGHCGGHALKSGTRNQLGPNWSNTPPINSFFHADKEFTVFDHTLLYKPWRNQPLLLPKFAKNQRSREFTTVNFRLPSTTSKLPYNKTIREPMSPAVMNHNKNSPDRAVSSP